MKTAYAKSDYQHFNRYNFAIVFHRKKSVPVSVKFVYFCDEF